ATGREKLPLAGHHGWVGFVAFAPDGHTVLTGSGHDRQVGLWDLRTGQLRRQFAGQQARNKAVALSADGKGLATGDLAGRLHAWDLAARREVRRIRGVPGSVLVAALSADGRLAAAVGADRVVRVWEAATGKERYRLAGHAGAVRALAFTPDG